MNDDPIYIGDVWSAMQVSDLSARIWRKVEQAIREEGLIPREQSVEVSAALYRYLRDCELPTTLAPVVPPVCEVCKGSGIVRAAHSPGGRFVPHPCPRGCEHDARCQVTHVPAYGPPVRCTLDAEPQHKFHQGTTEHGTITWSHAMGR